MSEPICPNCKRERPKGYLKALNKRRGLAVKRAFREAKAQGLAIGRPVEFSCSVIAKLRSHGFSYRKIAREIGCSLGTVQAALSGKRKHKLRYDNGITSHDVEDCPACKRG